MKNQLSLSSFDIMDVDRAYDYRLQSKVFFAEGFNYEEIVSNHVLPLQTEGELILINLLDFHRLVYCCNSTSPFLSEYNISTFYKMRWAAINLKLGM